MLHVHRAERADRLVDALCALLAEPLEAPTGIEPVAWSSHALEPNLAAWIERQAARSVALYRPLFESGGVE